MNMQSDKVSLSIVSHGQGHMVRDLLDDLAKGVDVDHEIILTLNVPEDERFIEEHRSLPIRVIRNSERRGFGANHNAAFGLATGSCFAIVNPDIRATRPRLRPLLDALRQLRAAGLAIPFLVGLRRDLALDQQLGKLTALRFAFEWHRLLPG